MLANSSLVFVCPCILCLSKAIKKSVFNKVMGYCCVVRQISVDKWRIICYNRNMKKSKINEVRRCPECGKAENQVNAGKNRSKTQRCFCNECKKYYTLNPKTRSYPEETRQQALKIYYAGASGRSVGKALGMSKANVYNWIKKNSSKS